LLKKTDWWNKHVDMSLQVRLKAILHQFYSTINNQK